MAKCKGCGQNMKPYYARDGVTIFICDNARLTIKKQNLIPYGYMFCGFNESEESEEPLIFDLKECVQLHAELESVKDSFNRITKELTLESLREATHKTLSDIEVLKNANLALMLGLKENQLCELFESGLKLGYALGRTSEYAITSLSKGIARQSRLIIDNIGITMRARTAQDWYKSQKGLDRLNSEQQKEAWIQYAIKLVTEKGKLLKVPKELAKRDQLKAKIANLKVEHGRDLK